MHSCVCACLRACARVPPCLARALMPKYANIKAHTIIVRHWSIGQCLTLMCAIFMCMFAAHPSTKSTARIRGAAIGYVVRMYSQTSASQHTFRNGCLLFVSKLFDLHWGLQCETKRSKQKNTNRKYEQDTGVPNLAHIRKSATE